MVKNPEGHTPRYWSTHRGAKRPPLAEEVPKLEPEIPAIVQFVRRVIGIGLIIAGVSLMDTHFWWGYALVVIGFMLLLWEICIDPALVRRRLAVQIAVLGVCFALFDLLTIALIKPEAPLMKETYSPRKGDYADGTSIAGIVWDRHLTELRIAFTDKSEDDYTDLDIDMRPDNLVYRAQITTGPKDCELKPLHGDGICASLAGKGGARKVTATDTGGDTDCHDDVGDVFITVAYEAGFRLQCSKLSSRDTVQVVFALVRLAELHPVQSTPLVKYDPHKPNTTGWQSFEIPGPNSVFYLFGPKPVTSTIDIEGRYKRNKQPFFVKETLPVEAID